MGAMRSVNSTRRARFPWLQQVDPFSKTRNAYTPAVAMLVGMILPLFLSDPVSGLFAAVPVLWVFLSAPRKSVGYFLMSLAFSSGFGVLEREKILDPRCEGRSVSLTGTVVSLPQKSLSQFEELSSAVNVLSDAIVPAECGILGLVQIQVRGLLEPSVLGRRISVEGVVQHKAVQWNHGRPPDQAGHFSRGITTKLRASSFTLIPGERSFIHYLRGELAQEVESAIEPLRPKGLVLALTLGHGSALPRADWARFRELGITHALVISGLHVGLLFACVWRLSRRLLLSVAPARMIRRDFSVLPALGVAFIYAQLAGFSLPTQRALIMLAVFACSQLTVWRSSSSHCLSVAALGMLIIHPAAILGSSFWLSLMATVVLVSINQLMSRWPILNERGRIAKALVIQCGVVAAMTPWVGVWYSAAGAIAILANLTVVPLLVASVVPAAVLALCISATGLFADSSQWLPARWLASGWLGMVDALSWRIGLPEVAEPLVGQRLWATQSGRGDLANRHVIASTADFRLVVLDVGQGLSVFVKSGNSSLLYDTGDASPLGFSQARHVVLPFLRHERIDAIDILVLSHGDRDHVGGIDGIREELFVRRVYGHYGSPCRPGQKLWLGRGTEITFLNGNLGDSKRGYPAAPETQESDNDGSCVVLVQHGGRRFLLTGDIEGSREQAMVRYWQNTLRVDVLIAAHHGSQTSSTLTFLKWARPDFVAFSAGRENRFGHPSTIVMDRFAARGTKISSTAVDGAISYSVNDHGNITVEGMRDGTIPYWLQLP